MRGRLLLLTLAVALVLSFAPSAASPACPGVDGFFCRRAVIPAPDIDFVRAADLDAAGGDGDLDFVAVASGQDDVFWYENDGQAFAGYQKRLHQHAITSPALWKSTSVTDCQVPSMFGSKSSYSLTDAVVVEFHQNEN